MKSQLFIASAVTFAFLVSCDGVRWIRSGSVPIPNSGPAPSPTPPLYVPDVVVPAGLYSFADMTNILALAVAYGDTSDSKIVVQCSDQVRIERNGFEGPVLIPAHPSDIELVLYTSDTDNVVFSNSKGGTILLADGVANFSIVGFTLEYPNIGPLSVEFGAAIQLSNSTANTVSKNEIKIEKGWAIHGVAIEWNSEVSNFSDNKIHLSNFTGSNYGVQLNGTSTVDSFLNNTITTSGFSSAGMNISGNSLIEYFENTNVRTRGPSAVGIQFSATSRIGIMNHANLITEGNNAPAFIVASGSQIFAWRNSRVATSGTNSPAILMSSFTTLPTQVFEMNNITFEHAGLGVSTGIDMTAIPMGALGYFMNTGRFDKIVFCHTPGSSPWLPALNPLAQTEFEYADVTISAECSN